MKRLLIPLLLLVALSAQAQQTDITGKVDDNQHPSYPNRYTFDLTNTPQAPLQYKLVDCKTPDELSHVITEMVKTGWVPLGQAFTGYAGTSYHFYQTMVKYGRG